VSGFRCRIDVKDLPNGARDLQFAYADRRTLAPLVDARWPFFPEIDTPLPDAPRRIRVHGNDDLTTFILVGAQNYWVLVDALDRACGKTFDDFPVVLDWGCGSGRVLRYVAARHHADLIGVDIDADNIGWCKTAFPRCTFQTTGLYPPLPFATESIDLVYGVSVFTHLRERDQFQWLEELRRITRPGGVLLLSFHGDHAWFRSRSMESCSALVDWKVRGFYDASSDPNLNGFIPDDNYYHDVYHDLDYITREWNRFFKLVAHYPGMLQGFQDLVVLERK
jgi:SAM-dependent methyltransferase